MKLAAVTVNWNRPDDTLSCVASLIRQVPYVPHVFVVDNGSTDDSWNQLQQELQGTTLIGSNTNLGFSGGYNLGLRRALAWGADFIFLINNDAIAAPNAIFILLNVIQPEIGAVAPLIYYADDPTRIWSSGGKTHPIFLEKLDEYQDQMDKGQLPELLERDFITGCALLLPRKTLINIGLFDEAYRLYYEDMDFSRRIRLHGLRIFVATHAKVWHKIASSSGGSDSPNERYWMGRSSILYFRKHVRGIRWLLVVPWRLASTIKTTIRLFADRKSGAALAYLRGEWAGLVRKE